MRNLTNSAGYMKKCKHDSIAFFFYSDTENDGENNGDDGAIKGSQKIPLSDLKEQKISIGMRSVPDGNFTRDVRKI